MAYRVFISHGWSDLWVAQQIERRIRQDAKAATFIDAFDIAKGDDFEDRIFGEMDRVQELVVLLTPWSVDRNWVWVEIGAARAKDCRIVPILYGVSLDEIDRGRHDVPASEERRRHQRAGQLSKGIETSGVSRQS